MNTIANILQNVCKSNNDFCCLCLNNLSEDGTHIDDEVYTSYNNTEAYLPMSEILCTLLSDEILDYVFTFQQICRICTQSAVSSFNFLKTIKMNAELLSNTINNVYNSINSEKDSLSYNTFYIALNIENSTSQQYYENVKKPVTSLKMALRRYRALVDELSKPKLEIPIDKTKKIKTEVGNDKYNIRGNDSGSIIKCQDCHKTFSSKLKLKSHLFKAHAPKNSCLECNKYFQTPNALEEHKIEKHNVIICSECGKSINGKIKFETHEMTHRLKLICPDCGRVYKNKSTFKNHIELNVCKQKTRASPSNAKFTCDYCNKKYTQKVSLRVHIQYEHGNYKYHVCKVCNKKFWAQSRLKAHMVKHTKERNFICIQCNSKFVSREALLYHTRIHTGEKPYECSGCDARFLSASRRSEHVRRHHTNATLACDICGSKFNSQNYLQKHKKGHFNSDTNTETDKICNVIPQKCNEDDFKMLTQDLKRMETEDLKNSGLKDSEVYHMQFTQEAQDYIVQISTV